MKANGPTIGVRTTDEVVAAVDDFRSGERPVITRAEVLRRALMEFLKRKGVTP